MDNTQTGGFVDPGASNDTVITQVNPDPNTHIAGAFLVPNYTPIESDWNGVIIGGLLIMGLAFMLSKK